MFGSIQGNKTMKGAKLKKLFAKMICAGLVMIYAFVFSGPVHATVILTEDPVFGSNSIIRDVYNNKDFLRLDFTTPYTYNEVLGEFGMGGVFEGWGVAALTDLNLLGISSAIVHGSTDPTVLARAEELRDWFCVDCVNLSATHEVARGLISDTIWVNGEFKPRAFTIGRRFNANPYEVDFRISGYECKGRDEEIFLIRDASPVPEPMTLLLFGSVLIGLLGFRKGKRLVGQ